MRKTLPLLAAIALPLAACATSPYGYRSDPLSQIIGSIGTLGSGYSDYGYGGTGLSSAAANACASVASRYGPVHVTSVRQSSYSSVKVYGYAQRGYRTDNWDCTFRSDGRITDFDI
ncbi:MAG TPA: hypothetical protein VFO32_01010 [Sphingomicrobium sp.]|nr:hypothetical protein [Sphingomicrobium sp.]